MQRRLAISGEVGLLLLALTLITVIVGAEVRPSLPTRGVSTRRYCPAATASVTEGGLDFTILSALYPVIYYQPRIALTESVGMAQLKAEYELRRARVVALAESFVILGLLSWLSVEYQSNTYMQEWVARYFWPAGVLLNGTLVGLVAGIVIGWIVAFYQGKRSREQMILDQLKKIA